MLSYVNTWEGDTENVLIKATGCGFGGPRVVSGQGLLSAEMSNQIPDLL